MPTETERRLVVEKDLATPPQTTIMGRKGLLFSGSLLFGLILAEIGLRLVGYTYPVFYTTDEQRGYALQPGQKGWYRREGESYVDISSAGLRDHEHDIVKPPDTLRVAVLGDSYAEALQVKQTEAFWAILEQRLQTCEAGPKRRIEVINFGVSGYGTAQELITLRTQVWQYAPDVVLLQMTTNNDVSDNLRALKRSDEIPYFVYRDGQLALDDSFRQQFAFRWRDSAINRAGRWLRDNLRIVQLLHQTHGIIKTELARRRETVSILPATAQFADIGIENQIYRAPQDDTWRAAWRVTEGLLLQMRDETWRHGAQFFVFTVSNAIQVAPDPAVREAFLRHISAEDLFYPDKRLATFGAQNGFMVVNLAPALQAYATRQSAFLHGFGPNTGNGHWNAAGHQLAGELLAPALCRQLTQPTNLLFQSLPRTNRAVAKRRFQSENERQEVQTMSAEVNRKYSLEERRPQ